jgi:hypothetical protein
LNFKFAVVVDQTQLSEFVQKNINARSRRPNQLGKRLLVYLYGYRIQAKVVAIIGQQQKSPCQPHLAGIEQLVDQVRFNSGGPSQPSGGIRANSQRASASLGLVPVPGEPQREVPSAVDTGEQQECDRACDGVGRERFLGNQSGRAGDQARIAEKGHY